MSVQASVEAACRCFMLYIASSRRERTGNLEGHVIIASYGFSARNVARTLREFRVPYIHVEVNGYVV